MTQDLLCKLLVNQLSSMQDSRKVLEKDSCWRERHLGFILLLLPIQDVLDVFLFCVEAITVTYRCFQ